MSGVEVERAVVAFLAGRGGRGGGGGGGEGGKSGVRVLEIQRGVSDGRGGGGGGVPYSSVKKAVKRLVDAGVVRRRKKWVFGMGEVLLHSLEVDA